MKVICIKKTYCNFAFFLHEYTGAGSISAQFSRTMSEETVWSGSALFAYAILSETSVYEISGHLL